MSTHTPLAQVQSNLLNPGSVTQSTLEKALELISAHQVDYADLYFESSVSESWVIESGLIKNGCYNRDHGVGVRAISGEKTAFVYADTIEKKRLLEAAQTARAIAGQGQERKVALEGSSQTDAQEVLYPATVPYDAWSTDEKLDLLQEINRYIRSKDANVHDVIASLNGSYTEILVAASDGTFASDIQPLVRLNITVIVMKDGVVETASSGGGARTDYHYFKDHWQAYADEALRLALLKIKADPMPAGSMDVVLGPGWPGVLLHEAVGHGLEGDFNRKGTSAYSQLMGQKVASELCTVIDNGTIAGRRGSIHIDDEGTPSQSTTLIENGILKGYLQDKHNARLTKTASTGNGRRQSYAHLPMPRMTNTYLAAGESNPDDIIASVDKGLYAVNFTGGQVDITNGKFVFETSEAYLIENGKITRPVRGVTLIGDGPTVMKNITAVGNNLELDQGVGTCGKEGQSVAVGVGMPTTKIKALTVGGTH